MHYIEVDGEPVLVQSIEEWGNWFASHDRKVNHTKINEEVSVSTVFLGVNHDFTSPAPERILGSSPGEGAIRVYNYRYKPLIYESMIFGGKYNEHCWRYSTRKEASEGHDTLVKMVLLDEHAV